MRGFAPGFFEQDIATLAASLIGARLLVDGVGGTIVETEAYDATDPASHSFRGPGRQNATMFGPVAHAYIYRSYGIHWCLNFVGGLVPGGAVLIRSLEPTHGIPIMEARRGRAGKSRELCGGPGRLSCALGLDHRLNGASLVEPPFQLVPREKAPALLVGRRIGITKAVDTPWRFGLCGSRFLSRPFPKDCRPADEAYDRPSV